MPIPQNSYYIELWETFISQNNPESLSIIYSDHFDLLYNFGFKYTSSTDSEYFRLFSEKKKEARPGKQYVRLFIPMFSTRVIPGAQKTKKNCSFSDIS